MSSDSASSIGGNRPFFPTDESSLAFTLLHDLFNGNAPRALFRVGQKIVGRALTQPMRVETLLTRMERGEFSVQAELDAQVEKRLARIEAQGRRTTRAVVFGSLLISATLLLVGGYAAVGVAGYVLSGVTLVWVVFTGSD